MRKWIIISILLMLVLITGLAMLPAHETKVATKIPTALFQSGDLIFREGRGAMSRMFRRMSLRDPRYSHAGIIHEKEGRLYVIHALADDKGKGFLREDLLEDFCAATQSNAYGVYRYVGHGRAVDSLAEALFRERIPFDDQFDLTDDSKLYCTELLYKIIRNVSGEDFLPLTTVQNVTYVACDDIYLSDRIRKIYATQYP